VREAQKRLPPATIQERWFEPDYPYTANSVDDIISKVALICGAYAN